MTTYTQTDLINKALGDLGVLAAGQTPPAEDFDAVQIYVVPLLAELQMRDLVFVDDIEAIPAEWFLSIAVLLADKASREFGLAGVPATASQPNPVLAAETTLREIFYARPTGVRQTAEYF